VCESKSRPTSNQSTHPHPYLTPDLKWLIFNSNRSGFPHIYAASVPEGMVEAITTV
jgi:Tol biopolymer transport system component